MRKIYTSIDIGSDTIRILVSEYFENKLRVLAVSSVRSKGIKHGRIVDEDALSERLKMALDDIKTRINIPIKKAVVVIPPFNAEYTLAHGNIPITSEDKIVQNSDIIKVQNTLLSDVSPSMELVNISPIDFTIYENGSEIETIKDPKGKMCDRLSIRAMVITAPKDLVISYVKLIEKEGIEVVDLTLSSIADFEEVKEDDMLDGVVGLINIGRSTTTISVFNKGIITNSSIINSGSKIITDDISYIYYVGKKNARKIMEDFGVSHPRYASKTETYEVRDINEKLVSINQFELSEIINKRLVQILNISKNELKVLTNKQISYIMVLGGITDMPATNFVLEDIFGNVAKTYDMTTLGIRKARFVTVSGSIRHFIRKIKLKGKEYSMFSSDDADNLVYNKTKAKGSVIGKFVNYFFDN